MWLFFCYTIQLITIKPCTKFQNPNPSSCWEIFDEKKSLQTNKQTDRQTNIITEKAKTIYPLYTSYRGYNKYNTIGILSGSLMSPLLRLIPHHPDGVTFLIIGVIFLCLPCNTISTTLKVCSVVASCPPLLRLIPHHPDGVTFLIIGVILLCLPCYTISTTFKLSSVVASCPPSSVSSHHPDGMTFLIIGAIFLCLPCNTISTTLKVSSVVASCPPSSASSLITQMEWLSSS